MENITLDDLVARYGKTDAEMKALKKVNDADKELIKNMLAESDNNKHTAGGYTVQRVVSTRESLNEDKLIPLLEGAWYSENGNTDCPYIKMVKCIDMNALEAAIYKGDLSADMLQRMNECKITQEVVTLRCTKAKEAE